MCVLKLSGATNAHAESCDVNIENDYQTYLCCEVGGVAPECVETIAEPPSCVDGGMPCCDIQTFEGEKQAYC